MKRITSVLNVETDRVDNTVGTGTVVWGGPQTALEPTAGSSSMVGNGVVPVRRCDDTYEPRLRITKTLAANDHYQVEKQFPCGDWSPRGLRA